MEIYFDHNSLLTTLNCSTAFTNWLSFAVPHYNQCSAQYCQLSGLCRQMLT